MSKEYIYKIVCTANNKVYVGRSSSYKRRKTEHFRYLSQNKHANPIMQSAYNKYGKEAFEFYMIEECDNTAVKDRELYWFSKMVEDGYVLFNYKIATSDGGIDSKSHITRAFIFEALDDKYDNNLAINDFCAKYGISNATYYVYLAEWESLRGKVMPRSVQKESSIARVAEYVKLFKANGYVSTKERKALHVCHQALRKNLPLFGLTFDDVRTDGKFKSTKERALVAIAEYRNGTPMKEACQNNDVSIPSFYKYKTEE